MYTEETDEKVRQYTDKIEQQMKTEQTDHAPIFQNLASIWPEDPSWFYLLF